MSAAPHDVPSPTPDLARIERALISVSDKQGLVELGKALAQRILPELESPTDPALGHDSSTNALIRRYRQLRGHAG